MWGSGGCSDERLRADTRPGLRDSDLQDQMHQARCRKTIFFFSCSCQSAVFFDRLGHPWPEHDCTRPERLYDDLRTQGRSAKDARQVERLEPAYRLAA